MSVRPGVPKVALLVSAGLAVAAFGAVAVSLTATSSPRAAAAPEPADPLAAAPWADELPPTPEPEPEPEPVTRTVAAVEVVDLSTSGTRLFAPGSARDAAVPVDDGAVTALVDTVVAAFDAHLTALQAGAPEPDDALGLDGIDVTPVTAALTDPDRWVTAASYAVRVGVRGDPEWLELTVTVSRDDGATSARLVVVPADPPRTLAAEVLP